MCTFCWRHEGALLPCEYCCNVRCRLRVPTWEQLGFVQATVSQQNTTGVDAISEKRPPERFTMRLRHQHGAM